MCQVALGVADGGLLLFDIARGVPTARLQGFRGDVQSLAWARFRLPQHKSDPPAQPAGAAPEGGLREGAGGAAPQPPEAAAPHGLSPAAGEAHAGTAGASGSEEQVLRLPGAQDASIGGGGIGGIGGGGGGLEDIEAAHPDPVRGADLSQLEADFERLGQRRERQARIAAAHSRHGAAAGDAAVAEAFAALAGASRGSVEPDEPTTLASASAAAASVEAGDSLAVESAEKATAGTVPAPAGAQHEQAGEPAGAAAQAAAAAESAEDELAAYCDLLAAGARDGIVQIWDCRSARIHLCPGSHRLQAANKPHIDALAAHCVHGTHCPWARDSIQNMRIRINGLPVIHEPTPKHQMLQVARGCGSWALSCVRAACAPAAACADAAKARRPVGGAGGSRLGGGCVAAAGAALRWQRGCTARLQRPGRCCCRGILHWLCHLRVIPFPMCCADYHAQQAVPLC